MARTFIQAIAQPTLTEPESYSGFKGITADNCTTYIQQSKGSFLGSLNYRNIIIGDGVNGDQVGQYPYELDFGNDTPGSISKIFEYLNAAGTNVKYTKITFSTLVNLLDDNSIYDWANVTPYQEITYEFEIYWDKYILFSQNDKKDNSHYILDFSSGEDVEDKVNKLAFVHQNNHTSNFKDRSGVPYAGKNYQLLDNLTDISGELTTAIDLTINLDTKKIIGLPFQILALPSGYPNELKNERAHNFAWTIETDDFATTVTAPAPQEDPVEIEGTKISELESATTLQDDDLVVISRDEGSDGSFDVSYNTSLSDLAAKISPSQPLQAKCSFDGSASSPTIIGGFNVLSITKNAQGDYTVTFGNSVTNPVASVTALQAQTTNTIDASIVSITSSTIQIITGTNATGLIDCTVHLLVF